MKLVHWSLSDTGLRRNHNEDSLVAEGELGLFAVADGMGGHRGGAFASRLALDVVRDVVRDAGEDLGGAATKLRAMCLRRWFEEGMDPEDFRHTEELEPVTGEVRETLDLSVSDEDLESTPAATSVMRLAVRKASAMVFREARRDPALRGMGTTVTAMLFNGGRMHVVHAGDSRAYLFRDGNLSQLTEDHSWITEQLKIGAITEEEARTSQFRHVITRSIGFEPDVEVDSKGVVVQAGDCYLLCSDGMSNLVENHELQEIMQESYYGRLPQQLVDLANDRGGDDNITVVAVYAANERSAAD